MFSLSSAVLYLFGGTALTLCLVNFLAPWGVVERWRLNRLPAAPQDLPAADVDTRDMDLGTAQALADGAVEGLARSRRILANGVSDLSWLLTTTWWSLLLGGTVGFASVANGTAFAEAVFGGGIAAVGFTLLFALAGGMLTLLYFPGAMDATDSVERSIDAWGDLARAHATLTHLGYDVPELPAFKHPLQGAGFLWVIVPQPIYAVFRTMGVFGTLKAWHVSAIEIADAANAKRPTPLAKAA